VSNILYSGLINREMSIKEEKTIPLKISISYKEKTVFSDNVFDKGVYNPAASNAVLTIACASLIMT